MNSIYEVTVIFLNFNLIYSDKCIGICNEEETCLIDNSGDPQCLDNSGN